MKKVLLLIIPLLFISCATTGTKNAAAKSTKYPWSTFNVKAGQEIKMPVDCGFVSYGKTTIQIGDWDYSIPKEFGNKTLVASFPYTYYFNGKKHDVFYEVIIKDVNLKKEIQDLPLYSEIKTDTVIGTASADNPGVMIRSVTGYDPSLVLDSKNVPVETGNYTYFDASTFMPTTPKFLTFQPVTSKKDSIEFWDYPETIEEIAAKGTAENENKEDIIRMPNFKIMIKTKLSEYPKPITSRSSHDILLRNMFYSFCNTEETIKFDGIPFHLVFYKDFENYLADEYKLGDDIYLYLVFLFGRDGEQYFYVRDFSIKSPEQRYDEKMNFYREVEKEKLSDAK